MTDHPDSPGFGGWRPTDDVMLALGNLDPADHLLFLARMCMVDPSRVAVEVERFNSNKRKYGS